jgi:hypothetical protein
MSYARVFCGQKTRATDKMTNSTGAMQAIAEMGWVVTLQEVNIFFRPPLLHQAARCRSVWSHGRAWDRELTCGRQERVSYVRHLSGET